MSRFTTTSADATRFTTRSSRRLSRILQEVDVQVGRDGELDLPDLAEHHDIHDEIRKPHERRAGDGAAGPDKIALERHARDGAPVFDHLHTQTQQRRKRQAVADDLVDLGERNTARNGGWFHA
ncbi:MAG: hypothetical protein LAN18_13190 [Acidobacteriia bacterium]|nr:hypothetical protein [Terriglobia bacterium]